MADRQQSDARSRLEGLLADPHEALDVEIKGWLDLAVPEGKADLAQALLALANHGGGYVVIGFTEGEDGAGEAPDRPSSLATYDQDSVNGIVKAFAEPAFHCQVHNVRHPVTGSFYPVISSAGRSEGAGACQEERTWQQARAGARVLHTPPRTI